MKLGAIYIICMFWYYILSLPVIIFSVIKNTILLFLFLYFSISVTRDVFLDLGSYSGSWCSSHISDMLPVFCFNMAECASTSWSEIYFIGLNLLYKMKHVQKTQCMLNTGTVLKFSLTVLILTELKKHNVPKIIPESIWEPPFWKFLRRFIFYLILVLSKFFPEKNRLFDLSQWSSWKFIISIHFSLRKLKKWVTIKSV